MVIIVSLIVAFLILIGVICLIMGNVQDGEPNGCTGILNMVWLIAIGGVGFVCFALIAVLKMGNQIP